MALVATIILASTVYGDTPYPSGDNWPAVVYNPVSNTYLTVFNRAVSDDWDHPFSIRGRWTDYKGKAIGPDFLVSDSATLYRQDHPKLAYDSANMRFLVTWDYFHQDGWDCQVYGRFINADGTFQGGSFHISSGDYDQLLYSMAHDPVNQRFLIIWGSWSGSSNVSYGRLLNVDGTPFTDPFIIMNAVSYPEDYYGGAFVAYDSASQRFLAAGTYLYAQRDPSPGQDIRGQLVNADGTLQGENFVIATGPKRRAVSSVAYDSVSARFLVAWADTRNNPEGFGSDIYSQLVNADGTLQGTNFLISSGPRYQITPSAAYDTIYRRFAIAWNGSQTALLRQRCTPSSWSPTAHFTAGTSL
jgi:hypothetical protein